jgi:hypothetical protein
MGAVVERKRERGSVVVPVAGPIFRRAGEVDAGGEKRRRLLLLLAAFADAGEESPPARELCRRLDIGPELLDLLLDALRRDRLVKTQWANGGRPGKRGAKGRRNRYVLLFLDRSS